MSPIMRRYRADDLVQVWSLHVEALKATGAYIQSGEWDDDLNNIERIYLRRQGEFLVLEEDGIIVGMGALRYRSATIAEIKRMRVHPLQQGRGMGQLILNELMHRAKELGYTALVLDTTILQIAAQRLYEKNGFVETCRATIGGFETIFYERTL